MIIDWLGFLTPILVIFSPVIVTLSASVLIALIEKRPVWLFVAQEESPTPSLQSDLNEDNPYASPSVGNPNPLLTDYTVRRNAAAEAMGFEPLGVFSDARGGIYRIRYDLWRIPTGEALVIIGSGRFSLLRMDSTDIWTRLDNGRWLSTFDSISSEADVSGLEDQAMIWTNNLKTLLNFHRHRISTVSVSVLPFSFDRPLQDLRELRRRRADRLEERGFVRFLDPEKSVWRYTYQGAMAITFWQHLLAFRWLVWPERLSLAIHRSALRFVRKRRDDRLPMIGQNADGLRQGAERMKPAGTSLLIVNDADQILLLLRDDDPAIPYPNMWDIPGGHVEPGETPQQCIVREINEEMGLNIPPPNLFRVTEFPDRTEHTFWLRMKLDIDKIHLTEGQRLRWFSEADAADTELAYQFNRVVAEFFRTRPWLEAAG